ncbi:unnamed protein product [Amoebophrya sp. A25]|nr:unnamed protein product [Amoebophrya sp. A25]|eukprot:GSA25T00021352001.1
MRTMPSSLLSLPRQVADAPLGGLYIFCIRADAADNETSASPLVPVGKQRTQHSSPFPLLIVGFCSLLCTSYVNFRSGGAFRQVIDYTSRAGALTPATSTTAGALQPVFSASGATGWALFFTLGSACSYLRTYCLEEVRLCFETRLRAAVFADLMQRPSYERTKAQTQRAQGQHSSDKEKSMKMVDHVGGDTEAPAKESSATSSSPPDEIYQQSPTPTSTCSSEEATKQSAVYEMSLLNQDVDVLADFYTLKTGNILRYSSSLFGGSCAAFYSCAILAAWGIPIVFGLGYFVARRSGSRSKNKIQKREDDNLLLEEHAFARIQGAAVIRCFGRGESETKEFSRLLVKRYQQERATGKRRAQLMGGVDLVLKSSLLALASGGSVLVRRAQITGGQFVHFLLSATMAGLGFYGLLGISKDLESARAAASRLAFLLTEPREREVEEESIKLPAVDEDFHVVDTVDATGCVLKESTTTTEISTTCSLSSSVVAEEEYNRGSASATSSTSPPQQLGTTTSDRWTRRQQFPRASHHRILVPTPGDPSSSNTLVELRGIVVVHTNRASTSQGSATDGSRSCTMEKSPPSSSSPRRRRGPLEQECRLLFPAPVSLTISKGDIIGVYGRSGCGKSTLIDVLLGERVPNQGHVFFRSTASTASGGREEWLSRVTIRAPATVCYRPKHLRELDVRL